MISNPEIRFRSSLFFYLKLNEDLEFVIIFGWSDHAVLAHTRSDAQHLILGFPPEEGVGACIIGDPHICTRIHRGDEWIRAQRAPEEQSAGALISVNSSSSDRAFRWNTVRECGIQPSLQRVSEPSSTD